MNKSLRRQTGRRITPPPHGLNPVTLTNNMKNHRAIPRKNPRAKCCPQHFAILFLLTPGAGVTPAEEVWNHRGSTLNDVISSRPHRSARIPQQHLRDRRQIVIVVVIDLDPPRASAAPLENSDLALERT